MAQRVCLACEACGEPVSSKVLQRLQPAQGSAYISAARQTWPWGCNSDSWPMTQVPAEPESLETIGLVPIVVPVVSIKAGFTTSLLTSLYDRHILPALDGHDCCINSYIHLLCFPSVGLRVFRQVQSTCPFREFSGLFWTFKSCEVNITITSGRCRFP